MSNEIKQGDKVRVSKDAPKEFERFKGDDMNYEVVRINPSKIIIQHKVGGLYGFTLAIPLKYLVKVDAEAKEAKFKVNDVVRTVFNETTHITSVLENGNYYLYGMGNEYPEDSLTLIQPYIEPTAPKFKVGDRVKFKNIYELQKVKDASFHWMLSMFASKEATITAVEDNGFYRVDIDPSIGGINDDMIESKVEPTTPTIKAGDRVRNIESGLIGVVDNIVYRDVAWVYCMDGNRYNWKFDDLELVQPTEPTGVEENDADNIVDEIGRVVEGYCKSLANLADSFDWQRYEADLAHDIAVKIVNKKMDNDPTEAADYAVSVAKAVVENLKRK